MTADTYSMAPYHMETTEWFKKGEKVAWQKYVIGWTQYQAHAQRYLSPGAVYTVEAVRIEGWEAKVYLEEVPGVWFAPMILKRV